MALFEPVFSALNAAGARYVVVGGPAVVLHGHARLTADVDLVLDLEPKAARRALKALTKLGLKARAPVDPLVAPDNPMLSLDLFVRDPIPFEKLWERAKKIDLGGVAVRIASIDDLIAMKRMAARPQDLLDIEALKAIKRARKGVRGG